MVQGTVLSRDADGRSRPVPGARLAFPHAAVMSDDDGRFMLDYPAEWPATLVVSALGFATDSLVLGAVPTGPLTITLDGSVQLPAAVVSEG